MKLVTAQRPGPKNSSEPTLITWETGEGQRRRVRYTFVRGAVAWPVGDTPGIVLMTGKELDGGKVIIFEEAELSLLSQAVEQFNRLWGYQPACYYFEASPESAGFLSHLRKAPELSGKLPFIEAPNSDAVDYGNGLIREFLSKGTLVVPGGGILAKQLSEARQDIDTDEFHALKALRFLLAGVDSRPWPFTVQDADLSACFT